MARTLDEIYAEIDACTPTKTEVIPEKTIITKVKPKAYIVSDAIYKELAHVIAVNVARCIGQPPLLPYSSLEYNEIPIYRESEVVRIKEL